MSAEVKQRMISASNKSTKLLIFDGDYKKLQGWWVRFTAYAKMHNFKESLNGADDQWSSSDDKEFDKTTTGGKAIEAAKN
jgi:hypothetical protein